MRTLRALLPAALSLLALVAGCTTSEPGSPAGVDSAGGGEVIRYQNLAELAEAVTSRQREDQTVRFEISSPDPAAGISGSGVSRIDEAGAAARVTMRVPTTPGAPGGDTEVVLLPGEVFLKLPPELAIQPGKPWVRVTPDGSGPLSQAFGPLLDQLANTADPTAQLQRYQEAFTIRGVAEQERAGAPVAVYDVDVDIARLGQLMSEQGQPSPVSALPPGTELALRLALDGDDRLREAVTTVTLQGRPMEIVTTFSGWGEPVDISPPPPEQVGQLPG